MFRRTTVCRAAVLALGAVGLTLTGAVVQAQTQRVEITGSAIKRTNVEGPAPVEIITRKDIERTGATNVNELLRAIPSMDIFDQGELASNSPAGSGTASVRLRGLSSSDVLVLLNGRRLPVNALYDSSGAGAAFDINSLPIGAIERVEILKDGGSAIYGADAVAGVVNFITKTDYQGAEGVFTYGQSSRHDGKEKRGGITAGFGDLAKNRFNVLGSIDVFKRDPIYRKDRDISSSVDFRSKGGIDARSSFAPTGNVVDPNTGGFVRVTYAPCPADSLGAANRCRYDFNKSLLTAYNGADRVSALGSASYAINPDTRAWVEVIYSKSKDHFEAHPVPDFFVVPITDPSQRPYEIPLDFGYGPNKVYIAGRFMQGGPRITDRDSTMTHVATGVEGTFKNFDWKAHISRGVSKVDNQDHNYYDANKWVDATTGGRLNPTVGTNDPAYVESLKVNPLRVGKNTLDSLHLQFGGDVVQMPAGALKFAVGGDWNHEKLTDTPDPLTQAGDVIGSIQQAPVNASRTYKAVFGELSIPILKSLEAQAAVRYDKYPNANATSPKVGLKWNATDAFALRGSYTRSFRAPVLKQLYGAQEQGATTVTDPDECRALGVPLDPSGECTVNAFQVNGSNPNLQPEKGKTYNIGLIFEASRAFSASVDWWKIEKSNDISQPTLHSAIIDGLWQRDGARFLIFTNLQNISNRQTSGVDIDARLRLPGTGIGNVTVRNLLTYYSTNKTRDNSGAEWAEFIGTYVTPRFRNALNVNVETGPWVFGATWRTTGGFWDTDQPFPIAAGTRRVGSFEELDVLVQYQNLGVKGLDLNIGVKNALDRMPPFSQTNANSNTYTQMGFAELYTNRGRFYYLTLKYTM